MLNALRCSSFVSFFILASIVCSRIAQPISCHLLQYEDETSTTEVRRQARRESRLEFPHGANFVAVVKKIDIRHFTENLIMRNTLLQQLLRLLNFGLIFAFTFNHEPNFDFLSELEVLKVT